MNIGKGTIIKHAVSLVVSIGLVLLVLSNYDYQAAASLTDRYRILSNAFTIPAVLFLGVGILVWIANMGGFVGVSWLLTSLKRILIPGVGLRKRESYRDYVERTRGKKATGYGFLFVYGLILLAAAIVFTVLFYKVRNI